MLTSLKKLTVNCNRDVESLSFSYRSYMTCMKCMFASCCKVVMSKHVVQFHEAKNRKKMPIKRKIPIDNPLHCICGFSSSDGNAIGEYIFFISFGKKTVGSIRYKFVFVYSFASHTL